MSLLRELVLVLRGEARDSGGVTYVKSAAIAEQMDLTPREVGVRVSYLSNDDSVPLDVSRWSYTCGSQTYRVEIVDEDGLRSYLDSTRGEVEPVLS